jgi:hypothetical protein
MKRLIALAASVSINAAVLGGLGWNFIPQVAPAGSVEVTELNGVGDSIVVAALADVR